MSFKFWRVRSELPKGESPQKFMFLKLKVFVTSSLRGDLASKILFVRPFEELLASKNERLWALIGLGLSEARNTFSRFRYKLRAG